MCSFLLVLLLFVVTFSTLQDSVTHWCPEEETAATKSGRQKSLVFAPHWLCAIDQTCTPTHQENPWETPLQGSAVSQNHPEAHHNGHSRPIPMEVHAVPTHQQKSCDPLRSLQSRLDNRCATSTGAQAADVSSHCVQRCMADNASLRLGTMGRVGSQRQVLELANASRWSSKSFSFTEHAQFAKSQRPKRKGIRQDQEERQSKNDRIPAIRRERCRKPQHIALRTAGSGDACLDKHRRIHWKQYAFCHNDLQPNTAEQLAQKKECVAALRAAYPDGNTIPSETKDLIDKMDKDIEKIEKENNKFVTKNIHSATKSLGKAQKALTETLEAKKAHRTRWIKHITEAVTTWQEQLKEYQKQQASLQEVITKAKEDIELARSAIQTLSSTASQAMLASMPPITPVTAEQEDGATEADKEEEKLQGQLQTVLQDCAAVLTRECTTPTLDVEDLTMDDAERDKKRQRSMEPFGGSTKS